MIGSERTSLYQKETRLNNNQCFLSIDSMNLVDLYQIMLFF